MPIILKVESWGRVLSPESHLPWVLESMSPESKKISWTQQHCSQVSDLLIFLIQPISERKKKVSILDKNSFTIWGFFQRNLARQIISIMKVIMRAFSFKIMAKLELFVAQTVETNILEFGIDYFVYMSNFEVTICLNSQYI